jgi:hypothetical protein
MTALFTPLSRLGTQEGGEGGVFGRKQERRNTGGGAHDWTACCMGFLGCSCIEGLLAARGNKHSISLGQTAPGTEQVQLHTELATT